MDTDRKNEQTFDQGRIEALEIAFTTLMKLQPEIVRQAFAANFEANVKTWDDVTLDLTVSEEWRSGLELSAASLLRLIGK